MVKGSSDRIIVVIKLPGEEKVTIRTTSAARERETDQVRMGSSIPLIILTAQFKVSNRDMHRP